MYFYRPQRSCEGYVFTGVCLSTVGRGGGVCLSAGWDTTPPPGADTPLGADTPPGSRHPPEQTPPHPPQEQTPPGADTPPPGADPPRADTPQDQTPPGNRHPSPRSRQPPRADTPPWSRHPPPQIRSLLRTVGILLECILVSESFVLLCSNFKLQTFYALSSNILS